MTELSMKLPHVPNHKNRFTFLDVARALAALAVMVQHSMEGSGMQALERGAFATTWLNLGETGVVMFFLVSGFIIPASIRGTPTFGKFWIRRIFRIYPLYWVIFFVTLAISVLLVGDPVPNVPVTIISHIFIVQSWIGLPNYVGGSWTLLIEILWYASFSIAAFSKYGAGEKIVQAFLVCFAGVIASAALFYGAFPFGRVCMFALCFMGYTYFLYYEEKISKQRFNILILAFLGLLFASIYVGFYLNPSDAAVTPAFSCVLISWGISLTLFPFLFARRHLAFANSAILAYLGEISYSVYLLHSPIITVLKQTGLSGPLFVLITAALTILIGTFTFKYIERPGIALARRWTAKPKAPDAVSVPAR
jgi:peptidoglycan/LPS O-acetylase OafA/YrhL